MGGWSWPTAKSYLLRWSVVVDKWYSTTSVSQDYIFSQVTKGFSNWKDATVAFRKHGQSKCHSEAVEVVVTLPKVTKDVGEQLSTAHRAKKEKATEMLQLILSSVRYLSRQGLALRGDNDSANLT